MPFSSTTIQGIHANIPSYYLDLNKQFNNIFYKKIKFILLMQKTWIKHYPKNANTSKIKAIFLKKILQIKNFRFF